MELANIPLDDSSKASLEEGIMVNGVGQDRHEPFILYKEGYGDCCKTAHKPYDLVVSAILIRVKMLAGKAFSLSSVPQPRPSSHAAISES